MSQKPHEMTRANTGNHISFGTCLRKNMKIRGSTQNVIVECGERTESHVYEQRGANDDISVQIELTSSLHEKLNHIGDIIVSQSIESLTSSSIT